jgi:tetrahydromethanopterin S-methyltransferase subunit C
LAMAHKSGFVVGFAIGLLAYLVQNSIISLSLFPFQASSLIFEIAGAMVLLSFVVGIVSTLRHEAVFGATVDAAIFGFTTGFGLLPIIAVLTAGHLPNPVPQAIPVK